MSIVVQNTGRFAFWLTLSDGTAVELSPRVGPITLPEREEKVNLSLKKLLAKGLVKQMETGKAGSGKSAAGAKRKTAVKKAKTTTKPKAR